MQHYRINRLSGASTRWGMFWLIWWLAVSTTALSAGMGDANIITGSTKSLLNSGSLVIAALLLLVGILLVAVVALYRDNKANTKDRQDMQIKTLKVLSDLERTIDANTRARIQMGG